MVTNQFKKVKFYFSQKQDYYLKLKKKLEYKNIKSIEDYDIFDITNLLFDSGGLNKVCIIIWNNNELLRRVVVDHPIKGSIELMKNNISNLILNRGGNSLTSKPNVFFFNNYHQMIICFTDIYLTQPWLRKEINYNDIANLYFISINEKAKSPVLDFHPIPFSCLYVNEQSNDSSSNNHNIYTIKSQSKSIIPTLNNDSNYNSNNLENEQ